MSTAVLGVRSATNDASPMRRTPSLGIRRCAFQLIGFESAQGVPQGTIPRQANRRLSQAVLARLGVALLRARGLSPGASRLKSIYPGYVNRQGAPGSPGELVVGAHKEPRGARSGGSQGAPGSSLWGPQGVPGSSLWALTRSPGELVVGGPHGFPGSSSWGPTRSPGELVVGAHKEPRGARAHKSSRGARCGGPQGAPGSSL